MKYLVVLLIALFAISCSSPLSTNMVDANGINYGKHDQYDFTANVPQIKTITNSNKWILVVGDSRANGYGIYCSENSPQAYNIYNTGVAGSSTASILNRSIVAAQNKKPEYVFIFTGVNDARILTPIEFKSNLEIIADTFTNLGIKVIIMDQTLRSDTTNSKSFPSQTNGFNDYRAVMMNINNTTYVPINYNDNMFLDQFHLNISGYDLVQSTINAIVQ